MPASDRTAAIGRPDALAILIPVYNDWDAVRLLLPDLDRVAAASGLRPRVLLVDDGSDAPPPAAIAEAAYTALGPIDVLALRRNLGHQRAIAIGLAAAFDRLRPDVLVVMDGDGEDAPEDVPRLLARLDAHQGERVIFAERRRRSERLLFRLLYALYRLAHRVLTGIPVRVGNFSAVPGRLLERLVVVSELWNHYAAAVFKARLPRDLVPTARARRLTGAGQMNFVALVAHGLSALSVHAEVMGVRLFVVTIGVAALAGTALGAILLAQAMRGVDVPYWAAIGVGVLLLFVGQMVGLAMAFSFLVLHARSQPLFLPIRDYAHFVSRLATLTAGAAAPPASAPAGRP